MNILIAASTMQVSTRDRSKEKPSLTLKAARLVGNICVLSLDLLCMARLIPCPSQRLVWYIDLAEQAGSKTRPGNKTNNNNNLARSIDNCKAALNMQGDMNVTTAMRSNGSECQRMDFYKATNYHLNEEKVVNSEVDGNYVQQMGIPLNMEGGGEFHKFMLDILYRNDAIVEIMTPSEFKEYCTNLFKQKTRGN